MRDFTGSKPKNHAISIAREETAAGQSEPNALVRVAECARQLGVEQKKLKRAPVARPGRRGRGNTALYEVEVVRRWLHAKADEKAAQRALQVAAAVAALPDELAETAARVVYDGEAARRFHMQDRQAAQFAAFLWYHMANDVRDMLLRAGAELPELTMPDKIGALCRF